MCDLGFVHRDVALRNVLVASDKACKVADFGMSRGMQDDIYQSTNTTSLKPVRYATQSHARHLTTLLSWTAPEALEFNQYSIQSDVWSFGVLLWELFMLGRTPYGSINTQLVWDQVRHLLSVEFANTGCRWWRET